MVENWTNEQWRAIDLKNKNILVSAAAGSGKTAVLVERIINKIINENLDLEKLVVVTFTRAAATNMKEKIRKRLEDLIKKDRGNKKYFNQMMKLPSALICTIDSFCLHLIRTNIEEVGIDPSFKIADNTEIKLLRKDVFNEVIEEYYEDEKNENFINFVNEYTSIKSDEKLEKIINELYLSAINNPFTYEYLEELKKPYVFKNVFESEIYKNTYKDIQKNISHFIEVFESLKNEILKKDVIDKKLESKFILQIVSDIELLRNIDLEEVETKNINVFSLEFERLKTVKGELESEYKYYKDIRDVLKTYIKEKSEIIEVLLNDVNFLEKLSKHIDILIGITKEYIEALEKRKKEKNIIEFTDIEHFALDLLIKKDGDKKHLSELAISMQEYYDEILIDEYQDSNLLQEEIMEAISNGSNRYMVGDVKQSIYGFRKARPDIFNKKSETYFYDVNEKDVKIPLSKNFRSNREILEGINDIFKIVMNTHLSEIKYDESAYLIPANSDENLENISEVIFVQRHLNKEERKDKNELEAIVIAKKIKELLENGETIFDSKIKAKRPINLGDIAILTRTASKNTKIIIDTLLKYGISATAVIKGSFLETYEIRPILTFLQVVDNPLDDISFASFLTSFFGDFQYEDLAKIRILDKYDYLYNNAINYLEIGKDESLKEKIKKSLDLVEYYKNEFKNASIYQLIWDIVYETGYYSYIKTMPNSLERLANIDILLDNAKRFLSTSYNGLFQFLRYLENIKDLSDEIGDATFSEESKNVVTVMTIHKSKGLEFPIVFLMGAANEFNQSDLKEDFIIEDRHGIALKTVYEEKRLKIKNIYYDYLNWQVLLGIINEELRLLYVALTRAKNRLFILSCADYLTKKEVREIYKESDDLLLAIEEKYKFSFPLFNEKYDDISFQKISSYMDAMYFGIKNSKYFKFSVYLEEDENVEDVENKKEEEKKEIVITKTFEEYPYIKNVDRKPKLSVTELKRLEQKDDVYLEKREKETNFLENLLKTNKNVNIGMAYHKVMELLDFSRVSNEEEIKEQIEEIIKKEVFDKESLLKVNVNDILSFCNSPLGQKVKEAFENKNLKREQEFMIGIPAEYDEFQIIQGTIDMYIENDEEIILVDYKTDRLKKEEDFKRLYTSQLEYYAKALEQASNKKVSEKYIYSFKMRKEIRM